MKVADDLIYLLSHTPLQGVGSDHPTLKEIENPPKCSISDSTGPS